MHCQINAITELKKQKYTPTGPQSDIEVIKKARKSMDQAKENSIDERRRTDTEELVEKNNTRRAFQIGKDQTN